MPAPARRADGTVRAEDVAAALTPATCLVTLMHANNETGALQPVAAAAAAAAAAGVRTHTDAAQSAGKVPLDVGALRCDYLTLVGHKLGAPKGVAALYARRGAPLPRLLHGGGQEGGRRAGTESVLHIVGLGAACALAAAEAEALRRHCAALRDELQAALLGALGGADGAGARVHAAGAPRLPNTLSLGVRGVSAAQLLHALRHRVAASAGAACHTHADAAAAAAAVSHVLRAMDVPLDYALGTLRLSVGRHSTAEDVRAAATLIAEEALRQRAAAAAAAAR